MDISALSNLSVSEKDDLKRQLKAEMMAASIGELISEMTDKCFEKCISKPGSSLDSYEQRCLGNCMDRFIDSWNTVSKVYATKLQASSQ